MPGASKPHARLIFSRHGEHEWSAADKFTGWVDVDLSPKGVEEAKNAGKFLRAQNLKPDVCYTSVLKRATKTLDFALEEADQLDVAVNKTWQLNDRMYGGLQGLGKKDAEQKHGAEQVQLWRKSFDMPPPEIEKSHECYTGYESKYSNLNPEEIPVTESLKDVSARVMSYWKESVEPELKAGKTVFVAAHNTSIRAIVKDIEGIPDDAISGMEIPTATPLVYYLDADLKPISNGVAIEAEKTPILTPTQKSPVLTPTLKSRRRIARPRTDSISMAEPGTAPAASITFDEQLLMDWPHCWQH